MRMRMVHGGRRVSFLVRACVNMAAATGGRAELVRECLAAEEKEALEAIKGDLCRWLAKRDVLGLNVVPALFLAELDSGEQLCRLAGLVREGARRWEDEGNYPPVRVPSLKLARKPIKAPRGSPMFLAGARDNAARFIQWCRELGVEEALIFESVGLVEHSDERRVVLCLLDVARFAEKVGVAPPELVALEREIERLESLPASEGDRTSEAREGGTVQTETPGEEEEEKCSTEGREEEKETPEEEKGGEGEVVEGEGESKEPPAKRAKRVSKTGESGAVTPPPNQPKRRRKSTPRLKKKDTVDEKVYIIIKKIHHYPNNTTPTME